MVNVGVEQSKGFKVFSAAGNLYQNLIISYKNLIKLA
ncbi:hypothetical protein SAMN05421820_103589 [Pedobacter steynii]|uniref:Uncharacterized protein n=1 Tax=Pedobacter steynii TaxID=430522 RepID=A0A1G9SG25_9SPHI|nr:hypothetical protein SAMN05421820_103589 [Pedobacter steynii]